MEEEEERKLDGEKYLGSWPDQSEQNRKERDGEVNPVFLFPSSGHACRVGLLRTEYFGTYF
jgi:hypothetical protein